MLLPDLILIMLLLSFAGMGLKDGFIQTLGRLIGSVIGFVLARSWYVAGSDWLDWLLPASIAKLIAFLFIFTLVTRLCGLALKLIDGLFQIISILPFLKSINKLLGAFVGFLEGFIILGGTLFLLKTLPLFPSLTHWASTSSVATAVTNAFTSCLQVLL